MLKNERGDSFLPWEMTWNSIRAWTWMELEFDDHGASQVSLISLAHYYYSSISSRLKLTNIFIFFLGKNYNRLPILTDIEIKRSEKVFKRIGPGGT